MDSNKNLELIRKKSTVAETCTVMYEMIIPLYYLKYVMNLNEYHSIYRVVLEGISKNRMVLAWFKPNKT